MFSMGTKFYCSSYASKTFTVVDELDESDTRWRFAKTEIESNVVSAATQISLSGFSSVAERYVQNYSKLKSNEIFVIFQGNDWIAVKNDP